MATCSAAADPSPAPSTALGTGEGHLRYGICVPCSKRPPGVRDAFSEAFGAKNRLLRYAAHFQGHSVRKTGFCGTEGIFGAKNSLLWYATHLQRPSEQPTPQTVDSLLPHRTHFQRRAVPKAAPAAPDAFSVRETTPARMRADIKRG